jgi:hypothetical protein
MAQTPENPDKVRVPLVLSAEELQDLDDWRFAHRHPTRTAALKAMMRLAIETAPTPKPPARPKARKKPVSGT